MKYFYYLLKTWVATAILSPLIIFSIAIFTNEPSFDFNFIKDFLQFLGIAFLIGLILSTPTFIVMGYWLFYFRGKFKVTTLISVILILGSFGTFLTFYLLDKSIFSKSSDLIFPLMYIVVMTLSSFLFFPKNHVETYS